MILGSLMWPFRIYSKTSISTCYLHLYLHSLTEPYMGRSENRSRLILAVCMTFLRSPLSSFQKWRGPPHVCIYIYMYISVLTNQNPLFWRVSVNFRQGLHVRNLQKSGFWLLKVCLYIYTPEILCSPCCCQGPLIFGKPHC